MGNLNFVGLIVIAALIIILALSYLPSSVTSTLDEKMKNQDKIEFVNLDAGENGSRKYRIKEDNKEITFKRFFHLLKNDHSFQDAFAEILKTGVREAGNDGESAFFFECPPFSSNNYDQDIFEFVLTPARSLNGVDPDSKSFSKFFSGPSTVVSFVNLGKDALLISPKPISKNYKVYRHFEAFVRGAPRDQVRKLLEVVAEESLAMVQKRKGKKIWLSTSGTEIHWLHVRLDSNPKYYSYTPYSSMDY